MNPQTLEKALEGLPIPRILFFPETDSTNTQALSAASAGAPEYTLVIAEAQREGRGRMDRKWYTQPGASLAFSILLHPIPEEQKHIGLFPLLGALSVCFTVREVANTEVQVKWPNDVLLDRKKVAGILAETRWQADRLMGLVLGIGINLLPSSIPIDEGVLFPATCVQSHSIKPIERLAFLRSVLKNLMDYRRWISSVDFLKIYQQNLAYLGQTVTLKGYSVEYFGKLVGVDGNGNLTLLLDNREKRTFSVGDLHLRLDQNSG